MTRSTGVSVFLCISRAYQGSTSEVLNAFLNLFAEFHIIVCGLDSIIARRWMNGMLVGKRND